MHTVSAAQLKKMAACPDQVRTFAKRFGCGEVTVTRKRLQEAVKLELDVPFWFTHAFPGLYNAYRAQRKTLYDAYRAQVKTLYDAYRAQVATLIADLLELP